MWSLRFVITLAPVQIGDSLGELTDMEVDDTGGSGRGGSYMLSIWFREPLLFASRCVRLLATCECHPDRLSYQCP